MKNNLKIALCVFLGATITSISAFSQHDHKCHANEKMDSLKASSPELKNEMEQSEENLKNWTAYFIENEYDPNARTAIYTIPVVYHIVHTNGPENVSDAQIYASLQRLNEDFNKLNASWVTVNPAFLGIVADIQVEFVLAKKTNTGMCTNGITRTYSEFTNTGSEDDWVGDVAAAHGVWPGNKYLNIFVCASVGEGIAGYTTYPAGSGSGINGMKRGIHIRHDYITDGAISHETGHWLNLPHCWGSTNEPGLASNCSTDDDVADTPNTIGWQSCNINGISCGTLDNVENYMEYSGCRKMFTEGQKARMHAALNSSEGGRNNLWSPSNLTATGVNLPDVLCQANFSANRTEICVGQTVTFTDESYSLVTGTNWTFTGGTPSSSTATSPTITYNTPGVYSVTLQATDGSSSITKTKTNYIIVLANTGESLPYSEGFENLSVFPDNQNFTVSNNDGEEAWEITSAASYSGDKSVWLNNYNTPASGTKDAFISGPIDLSGVDPADPIVFNFKYAYRKVSDSDDEWLRFFVSNDCGVTWILRKNLHGDALSEFTTSSSYMPSNSSAWYSVSVTNINSTYYVSNMRFKFEFQSDGGNNIYIDDINLYPASMASIDEEFGLTGLSIYPNPVTDLIQVSFTAQATGDYAISILNALGQVVGTVYQGELSAGVNQLGYSTALLPQGVYFLRIESQGNVATQKFVKN
jgi:PKD repeat protein